MHGGILWDMDIAREENEIAEAEWEFAETPVALLPPSKENEVIPDCDEEQ